MGSKNNNSNQRMPIVNITFTNAFHAHNILHTNQAEPNIIVKQCNRLL